MPNKASAKKMLRKDAKRNERNRSLKSFFKTVVLKVMKAIESKSKDAALVEFQKAQPIIHKISGKGIYHINKASRVLSRLSAKIKLMPGDFNGLKKN